jgi:hypothetical protein
LFPTYVLTVTEKALPIITGPGSVIVKLEGLDAAESVKDNALTRIVVPDITGYR